MDTVISSQGSMVLTSNQNVIVPTAGTYMISLQMAFDAGNAGMREFFVFLNGNSTPHYACARNSVTTSDVNCWTSTHIIKFVANDSLAVKVYQTNTGLASIHIGSITADYVALFSVVKLF